MTLPGVNVLEFSMAVLYRTTQSLAGGADAARFRTGAGLLSAAGVAANSDDYAMAMLGGVLHAGLGNPDVTIADVAATNDGKWHMAAMTRTVSTGDATDHIELFRDGVLRASAPSPGAVRSAVDGLVVGAHPTGPGTYGGFFVGDVAEVLWWDQAFPPRIWAELWRAARSRPKSKFRATLLRLDSLAARQSRTPRELLDAANAFSRYRARVIRDRTFSYDPLPSKAKYGIGPWAADRFEDTSANSAEDMFNAVEATAPGFDGTTVEVRRYSSELAEAAIVPVSSPSFPSANPATGTLSIVLSGTFRRGRTYRIRGKFTQGAGGAADFEIGIGDLNNLPDFHYTQLAAAANQVIPIDVAWTPREDTTSAQFEYDTSGAFGTFTGLHVERGIGTLLDRRDEVRLHRLEIGFQTTAEILEAMADTFLRLHSKTPLRGSVAIANGDLLNLKTGETVHPRQLVCEEGELVHFHAFTDPDTGATGRDGAIASVTYDPSQEIASVAIDNQRDNFEVLLARYALVTGQGTG